MLRRFSVIEDAFTTVVLYSSSEKLSWEEREAPEKGKAVVDYACT